MQFAELAQLADRLAAEASRLRKRAAIAEAVLRAAQESPAEAGRFCLFLAGQPFAEADPRKLNAGGALLTRVLKDVAGASDSALNIAYRKYGDLGAAAFDLLTEKNAAALNDPRGSLTLTDIADAFDTMARARTTAVRSATVDGLLRRATPLETKYLLKLMLGDMRIGVKQSLVEEAIAVAADADVAAVRHAVMLEADLSRAVERAFAGTLAEAHMRLFHPLGFMLASPVETPEEAVERFTVKTAKPAKRKPKKRRKKAEALIADAAAEEGLAEDVEAEAETEAAAAHPTPGDHTIHAVIEDKYDGIRAQLHCADPEQPGRVAIYSRNREDITESFPELEEAFAKVPTSPNSALISARGLIVDGEILAWDLEANRALPFSILGQRIGRKRVDDAMRRAIPVIFMAFDLMYADNELLLPKPLADRRAMLDRINAELADTTVSPLEAPKAQSGLFEAPPEFDTNVLRLRLSPARMAESAEAIDQAYRDARARANEGVMIKDARSAYLPGRRGLAWLKLKRELATLDVVITGCEFGHGRRAGLLSDYTFAVRGPDFELLNVGKAYSGVTDAEIAELTEWLQAHTLDDHGYFRTVEPIRVLEVAFNNIMRSDRHSSGFALRFPRILRVRDDKPVEEIDTLERVEEIYNSQPDKALGEPNKE